MTAVLTGTGVAPDLAPAPRPRPHDPAVWGLLVVALSVGWLVQRDGSAPWGLVRLLVVFVVTALALLAQARGGRALAAFAALLVGCLAVGAGSGIGPVFLAKTGLSGTALAGLVALLGGLVLAGAGGWRLVRRARSWWRLLAAPVALVLALFVALPVGVAVSLTNVPREAVGTATPGDQGLPFSEVSFPARDGVALSGWYVPSRNGAAVALLHGAHSTRSAVLNQAVVLARHGYGVLLFDARGHGRSGDRAMEAGWYGDEDVSGAVTFLLAQPDVNGGRVGVVGESMGGEEALGAAAADTRIRVVVAEGATVRTAADKRGWLPGGLTGTVQRGLDAVQFAVTDLLTAASPPIDLRSAAAAAAPRPVLLVVAGTVADESRAAAWIRGGAPASVQVWVVPGAGHTGGLATQPVEWSARVSAFLDAALTR